MPKRKASELAEAGFTVQCPTQPSSLSRKGVTDIYDESDTPELGQLRIDFTISPGRKWAEMHKYRNVRYQDTNFPVGSFIFVNRRDPPPPPPPEDASEDEVLEFQRKNMWVGKIQEARAENENKVFLRVFWLYWPEELPGGAQQYHGQQELVLSNHAEIVDATTISGPAEISYWNEADDQDDRPLASLFWRQTFDLTKLGPNRKGGLSPLRKHCKCRKEYNPDLVMFKCPHEDCGHWNHQACLEKDLLENFNVLLGKNTLQKHLDRRAASFREEQEAQERSLGETIAIGAESLIQGARNAIAMIDGSLSGEQAEAPEPKSPISPASPKKRGRPPKAQTKALVHNEGRIQVKVRALDAKAQRSDVVVARVRLLPGKGSTAEEKEWVIGVGCLKCEKPLD